MHLTIHRTGGIIAGSVGKCKSGGYMRTFFIVATDGERLDLDVFAESAEALAIDHVHEDYPYGARVALEESLEERSKVARVERSGALA